MDRYAIVEELNESQIEQLHQLVRQQWWGTTRSLQDVRVMVENTSLIIGLTERSTGNLVGSCRVLTDFVFRATIYDVMVDQQLRGHGLGKKLLDHLCNHPKLKSVSLIYLACEPNLFKFYERWGFKPYEGRAQWMMKQQREE